jgi:transposase
MFHMNKNLKVVLAVEPVDLRKSFNGLYAVARCELGEMPEDGALFVFSNRAKNRIKVLCFDGTGCWVSVKRLEQGTQSSHRGV